MKEEFKIYKLISDFALAFYASLAILEICLGLINNHTPNILIGICSLSFSIILVLLIKVMYQEYLGNINYQYSFTIRYGLVMFVVLTLPAILFILVLNIIISIVEFIVSIVRR